MLLDVKSDIRADRVAGRLLKLTPDTDRDVWPLRDRLLEKVNRHDPVSDLRRHMFWQAVRARVQWWHDGYHRRHMRAEDESVAAFERGLDEGMRICGHAPDGGDIAEEVAA